MPYKWEDNNLSASELQKFQQIPITIKSLGHVTHEKEFDDICADDPTAYTLKSSVKKGKSGYEVTDGSPLGYSFVALNSQELPNKKSLYCYVKRAEELLPGSYIWWSIEVDPAEIPKPYPDGYSVSNALCKSYSPYGNKKIYGYVKHAFHAYQSSFCDPSTDELPRIELRIGGTLRYKFEVCYVVILCRENEPLLPLDQYPLWEEGKDKIEYNNKGEVKWVNTMKITVNNGIKLRKGDTQTYSWDQTVFGFYFPKKDQTMKCYQLHYGHDFQERDVKHEGICLKSRLVESEGHWMCPNDIDRLLRKQNNHESSDEESPLKKHHKMLEF